METRVSDTLGGVVGDRRQPAVLLMHTLRLCLLGAVLFGTQACVCVKESHEFRLTGLRNRPGILLEDCPVAAKGALEGMKGVTEVTLSETSSRPTDRRLMVTWDPCETSW